MRRMRNSILTLADSYKYSHASQYPANTESIYEYFESRGGKFQSTMFNCLQYYILEYLIDLNIKSEDLNTPHYVDLIAKLAKSHGVPFDLDGWHYIANLGYLPIRISAVKEGTLVPNGMPSMIVESTDSRVPWIAGFVETLLMKLWYPINIATKSFYIKRQLLKYGSEGWDNFAYHNFGDRGSSSVESAAIGGFAHSIPFFGTDNLNSLLFCNEYYNDDRSMESMYTAQSYSVFATEHSSTTSRGREGEEQFVIDQLLANPDAPIMSFVADSYDVFNFVNFCTAKDSSIRNIIESRPHQKLVMRPDSGNPIEVISKILIIMMSNNVKYTLLNGKILFDQYAILWGDGINEDMINQILITFTLAPEATLFDHEPNIFASENFIFGSGGNLMQQHDRDTNKFAIKCSNITLNDGTEIEVYKDPITDHSKKSKRGKVKSYITAGGCWYSDVKPANSLDTCMLEPVFENGKLLRYQSLSDIRNICNAQL